MKPLPTLPKRFRYHVLFSYASANAEYIRAVRAALPKEILVFDYADNGLWGQPLAKALERRYTNEAPFCVVFLSEAYLALNSRWTRDEFAIVRRVADKKPGYMLPVMVDGAKVPEELGDIVWLEKTLSSEQVAANIDAKIREPPPQPWWFHVSKEAKIAAAATLLALIALIVLTRPSRTSIKSADADVQAITAHVANVGAKRATLVGQRLKFGTLPIVDTDLNLGDSSLATVAPGWHDVKLTVLTLEPKCDADGNRPDKQAIDEVLDRNNVTLEIDVRESDDAPGHSHRETIDFPAARLRPFIGKWVPSRVPPC